MSQDIFQKNYDEKIDNYFNNINVPNYKNTSNAMKGIMYFGGPTSSNQLGDNFNKPDRQSVGLFPSLNHSKRECKYYILTIGTELE